MVDVFRFIEFVSFVYYYVKFVFVTIFKNIPELKSEDVVNSDSVDSSVNPLLDSVEPNDSVDDSTVESVDMSLEETVDESVDEPVDKSLEEATEESVDESLEESVGE